MSLLKLKPITDPHVAGGQVARYDWWERPSFRYWHANEGRPKRYMVAWWPPSRVVSVARSRYFRSGWVADTFYHFMVWRGYRPTTFRVES